MKIGFGRWRKQETHDWDEQEQGQCCMLTCAHIRILRNGKPNACWYCDYYQTPIEEDDFSVCEHYLSVRDANPERLRALYQQRIQQEEDDDYEEEEEGGGGWFSNLFGDTWLGRWLGIF